MITTIPRATAEDALADVRLILKMNVYDDMMFSLLNTYLKWVGGEELDAWQQNEISIIEQHLGKEFAL